MRVKNVEPCILIVCQHQRVIMFKYWPSGKYALARRCSPGSFILVRLLVSPVIVLKRQGVPHHHVTVDFHIVPYIAECFICTVKAYIAKELLLADDNQAVRATANIF